MPQLASLRLAALESTARVRTRVPPPQVSVQRDQADHSPITHASDLQYTVHGFSSASASPLHFAVSSLVTTICLVRREVPVMVGPGA